MAIGIVIPFAQLSLNEWSRTVSPSGIGTHHPTVERTHMSLVSLAEHHDYRTCREVYDLRDKEYHVANQYRVNEKQRRRRAPHRKRGDADARGTALPDKVHNLRHVARDDQSSSRSA